MQVKSTAIAEVLSAQPDAVLVVVLEVIAYPEPHHITGRLLEQQAETAFARTVHTVEAFWPQDIHMMMGTEEDIQPDAVFYFRGRLPSTEPLTLEADQVVKITGYVTVR